MYHVGSGGGGWGDGAITVSEELQQAARLDRAKKNGGDDRELDTRKESRPQCFSDANIAKVSSEIHALFRDLTTGDRCAYRTCPGGACLPDPPVYACCRGLHGQQTALSGVLWLYTVASTNATSTYDRCV